MNGSAVDNSASRKAFEEWRLSSSGWAQADLESVRSGVGYLLQTMDLAWKGSQANAAHMGVTGLDKRWWPIETVPRGVKVLILQRGRGGRPKIDIAAYERYGDVKGMHRGSGVFYTNVTRWVPLPEIREPPGFSGYSPLHVTDEERGELQEFHTLLAHILPEPLATAHRTGSITGDGRK